MPDLGAVLQVAQPCCGLDYGEDFWCMGIPYQGCHIYDLESDYRGALSAMHTARHATSPALHLGDVAGDVIRVPLMYLLSQPGQIHLLRSGPPCPPWSSAGSRNGQRDRRAPVFERILEWIVVLVAHKGLIMVCLENVGGVLREWGGEEAFFDKVVFILRQLVPELKWRVDACLTVVWDPFLADSIGGSPPSVPTHPGAPSPTRYLAELARLFKR